MSAIKFLKTYRVYEDDVIYNSTGEIIGTISQLKKLMPVNTADIQGHGIVEFYTPEQVVEILRLFSVAGRSEESPKDCNCDNATNGSNQKICDNDCLYH
jgi:hypothetical protein